MCAYRKTLTVTHWQVDFAVPCVTVRTIYGPTAFESSTNNTTVQPTFTTHIMAEPSVQNQRQPRRAARPNHSRRRPHGRGGKGGAKSTPVSTGAASSSSAPNANTSAENEENGKDVPAVQTQPDSQQDESQEQDLCWICAEPIKYYAVSECNHRTCHVCALRLRALYKKLDCTFCKVRIGSVLHRAMDF